MKRDLAHAPRGLIYGRIGVIIGNLAKIGLWIILLRAKSALKRAR